MNGGWAARDLSQQTLPLQAGEVKEIHFATEVKQK